MPSGKEFLAVMRSHSNRSERGAMKCSFDDLPDRLGNQDDVEKLLSSH